MDVVETLLPGVGIRYELTTATGALLAFVVRRDGLVEVSVFDSDDPDRARDVVRLDASEAAAVADILGAPRMTERFADLSREVPGLHSARITVPEGSRFAEGPLGDTRTRTRTGCSVVAIVRPHEVVTAPAPTDVLHAGDVLVVIGSRQGLEEADRLISTD